MLFFLLFILLLTLVIWLFLQQPQCGKVPIGARLERIQKVPTYHEGTFHNLSPTPVMAEGLSRWDAAADFLKPGKDRKPARPLPSVKTNLKTLPREIPTVV